MRKLKTRKDVYNDVSWSLGTRKNKSTNKLENKMQTQKLTNLQLELLKVFSYQLNQQQLSDIKNLLANYFAEQATQEMDKLWDENNWDNNTMTDWANEHLRTPYNPS